MTPEPQRADLILFLSDPASYGKPVSRVSVLQTHISVVALTEQFVYKLKKNVTFDFLDFSTLEKRLFYCQEEVRLNQRLSTALYMGILPIYRDGQTLSFQPGGEVVDYVVQMNRLSDKGLLINQIKESNFSLDRMNAVANRLLDFYRNAPSTPEMAVFGTVETIRTTIQEVTADFADYTKQTISPLAAQCLQTYLSNFIQSHRSLFDQRIRANKIIEGHGDLRSEHIHSENNIVTIYDCIEFSQRLRCLDWLNDLAFLLMDLDYRHNRRLAQYLQDKLAAVMEIDDITHLMDFYKTYRACVRGKVDTLKYLEPEMPPAVRQESKQKAIRYFQLAFRYAVLGSQPTVLVCMGGGATGKSTLAAALSGEFGLSVLSSDVIRKQKAGLNLLERLPDEERTRLYGETVTDEVYHELAERALEEANQTGAVIVDATYRGKDQLNELQWLCWKKNIHLLVIQTTAPEAVILKRLQQRETEPTVSDLRSRDYEPERFGIRYPIERHVESCLKVDTHHELAKAIQTVIIPWLMQQDHYALSAD